MFRQIKKYITWIAFLVFLLLPLGKIQAWDAMAAASYHRSLDTIYDKLQGIIMGQMKKITAQSINEQIVSLITGGANGSMFITDWKEFLTLMPRNRANLFTEDLITKSLSGRNKKSQYIAFNDDEGFSSGGANYLKSLEENAKMVTTEISEEVKVDYTNDPSRIFSTGNFKELNIYLSGCNNPWAYQLCIKTRHEKKLEEEEREAMVEAIAGQSYTGQKTKEGKVLTPGITVKDMLSNVQDIGNKIMAGSTHPEELIIDFGLNPQPIGVPTQPIPVTQRIITNFYTAKRMLHALTMTVQRHEATFGVLEIDVQKRVRPAFLSQQQP